MEPSVIQPGQAGPVGLVDKPTIVDVGAVALKVSVNDLAWARP